MTLGLLERMDRGDVLVLDGAIGTELQRRGVPMDSAAWCATANASHPDVLAGVHTDYLAAGADIITTNTFATARHVLEPAGLGDEVEALNRTAVEVARRAAAEAGDEILVAGSMSSMASLGEWSTAPVGPEVAAAYAEQAEILAEEGVDLLLAEMLLDLDNAALVIAAATRTGLPVVAGWSASPDGSGGVATYRSDGIEPDSRTFDQLMGEGTTLGADLHGIMHSEIGVTGPALRILGNHWKGPAAAYAEIGRFEPPNWVFSADDSPPAYAAEVLGWVANGVRLVGGCCGTTPGHIAAITTALAESQ